MERNSRTNADSTEAMNGTITARIVTHVATVETATTKTHLKATATKAESATEAKNAATTGRASGATEGTRAGGEEKSQVQKASALAEQRL